MKSYLLDTHSFLWSILQPEKLGQQAVAVLENTGNKVFVSSITFWEISLKYSLGKLELGCKPDDLLKVSDDMDFEKIVLTPEEAALFYQLPNSTLSDFMITQFKIVIPAGIAGIQAPWMDLSLPSMALDTRSQRV